MNSATAAAPFGVAICATAGLKNVPNASPTELIHVPAMLVARKHSDGGFAGGGIAAFAPYSATVQQALRMARKNRMLRDASRPGLPTTTTGSPAANVSAAQPYCFIAVDGYASTTQTRSPPFSRTER